MRVTERRELHAFAVHEIGGIVFLEPAVGYRFLVEPRARIRGGQRDLDCVWIDFLCKSNGFLDRLPRLAGQAEDERPMDRDAKLAAVLGETARYVSAQAFLDIA